jgi:hypothetical protein
VSKDFIYMSSNTNVAIPYHVLAAHSVLSTASSHSIRSSFLSRQISLVLWKSIAVHASAYILSSYALFYFLVVLLVQFYHPLLHLPVQYEYLQPSPGPDVDIISVIDQDHQQVRASCWDLQYRSNDW